MIGFQIKKYKAIINNHNLVISILTQLKFKKG